MNSHIVIKANNKPLVLPDDFSIDVDFQNPLFNDTEMFSYPVQIPLDGNRHMMKNIDDVNSDMRPVDLEHTPMRMLVDGMPFASGTAIMQDDEEVIDSLTMNMDAGEQSFDELIGDLTCQDITIPSKYHDALLIGEKIGDVHCEISLNTTVEVKYDTGSKEKDKTYIYNSLAPQVLANEFQPQALGFSYPGKCQLSTSTGASPQEAKIKEVRTYRNDNSVNVPVTEETYINVSTPYGESMSTTKDVSDKGSSRPAVYANARVCYKHYALDDDGGTSDSIETEDPGNERENRDKYWVLDADRPQSGICFYVMFFLDCLFEYLGVTFDKSAITKVGDLNRLVFFTTHCKYDIEILHGSEDNYYFDNLDDINNWLSSRGCGGQLKWEDPIEKTVNDLDYTDVATGVRKSVVTGQDGVETIKCTSSVNYKKIYANIHAMYANADNFPDESVSTIISSLENSFGIRFHYDYEQKKVTAYLIRDVFRTTDAALEWRGAVHSMTKISEKITGVRMCYSAESDSKEERNNVKNQVKDYDTDYDYIEYPQDRTITDKSYMEIRSLITNTNMNVYVDKATGNAYRVKIDSDYEDANSMYPALFEVGAHHGVELGDCSSENEDFVEEFSSDFEPVPFNDVNYHREKAALNGYAGDVKGQDQYGNTFLISNINAKSKNTLMAAFVDEDMEHEFVEQDIRNDLSSASADVYLTEVLKLVESYDPSDSDDGNSPLQTYDWGLAIAIMRGGGADATVQSYDPGYDGFGNSKWRMVAGEYAMTDDSLDPFGSEYDYNGDSAGVGDDERFSLKIRAYKQPSWATEPLCDPDICDATGRVTTKIRTRGLLDTFMIEYFHFLLNRKKYKVMTECSVAELVNIQSNWLKWYNIGGKKCLINKASTTVQLDTGLQEVELEVYSL